MKVTREEEHESITDANNVTGYTFSLVLIPQIENSNDIFASEKLENPNKLVNSVAKMTINNVGYELNAATASASRVEFASDPDIITHTNN